MNRRTFIQRMSSALVGVGMFGELLLRQQPQLVQGDHVAMVVADSSYQVGTLVVRAVSYETGTITVETLPNPLGANDWVFTEDQRENVLEIMERQRGRSGR